MPLALSDLVNISRACLEIQAVEKHTAFPTLSGERVSIKDLSFLSMPYAYRPPPIKRMSTFSSMAASGESTETAVEDAPSAIASAIVFEVREK